MLQVASLSSLHQQGTDLREFAREFKSAAEGLNYNDGALNDLLNCALDEPSSMEGMLIMEHLSWGICGLSSPQGDTVSFSSYSRDGCQSGTS